MNKYQFIISIFLLCTGISSCSSDDMLTQQVKEGNVPISLSGALPLSNDCGDAGATTYDNIFLSAKVDKAGEPDIEYFKNKAFKQMELPQYVEGNTNADNISLKEALTYPLGNIGLHLFAHSGKVTDVGNLELTAGRGVDDKGDSDNSKDFIISNGDNGKGTLGSSEKPSTTLTFRHIMTKIYVDVVLNDETDKPVSDPESIKITLTDGLAALNGNYPINSESTGTATDNEGNYSLQKGINYLIPNGKVLADHSSGANTIHPIKALIIDDYTADLNDLANLTLTPVQNNSSEKVELLPGYAYKITFNIKRLKVTSITFEMLPWEKVVLGSENSSYVPAKLNMNLGNYNQIFDKKDTITKVVLHTSDKQYVGNIIYNSTTPIGQFVSLPAAGGTAPTVDLYTSQGLLIAGVTANSYAVNSSTTDRDITVSLSAGGMKTKDGNAYSEANPYLVETPLQFMNLYKETTGTFFQQANDLDFESLNVAFIPITSFSGTYDGNGKRILNATFSGNGLFATNNGTIKNIRIASGKIAATSGYAGSICGTNETNETSGTSGNIVACINEAQIHGTATHAGGICGKNSGTITACLNTGDIFTGSSYSGGICGENMNTDTEAITACVNVGMMNRESTNMAGICGTTATGTSILKTCYWLTGTAKKYSGNDVSVDDTEVAVHGYTPVGTDDVADLSPQMLRNEKLTDSSKTTTELLDGAIPTNWNTYEFTYAVKTNGCVWPMPVKKSNP